MKRRHTETRSLPRVLHIVESLDRGAVEGWLLRMLAHGRKRGVEVDWTFYCTVSRVGKMEQRARALGARVVHSPVPIGGKVDFIRALRTEMQRSGYDVLHCHHDLVSAIYLLASMRIPLRRRIVHVHNADEDIPTPNRLKQYLYREPMRRACLATADLIVGISDHTLDTFLAQRPRRPGCDLVHHYGVDPEPFMKAAPDRIEFRTRCDLPEDALILLFGGRLVPEKNPVFAVDVLADLRALEPRAVAVFAGTGSQEERIKARSTERGVEKFVRLLGWRDDLPEIMRCSDWFILPHPEQPMEGFGLAVVEAQLAGLRMLLSQGIPDDPILPAASFHRIALSAGAGRWAKAAVDLLNGPVPSQADTLEMLAGSNMDMDRALNGLLTLHT